MKRTHFTIGILAALAALTMSSCGDAFLGKGNPVDPQAPNYQGYPSITDPGAVKPASGGGGAPVLYAPKLVALKVVGADLYHFQIATDAAFSTVVHDNNAAISNEYTPATWTGLDYSVTYYWRVRAHKDGAWGGFSTDLATFSLTTPNAGTTVPVSGAAVSSTTPSFDWADQAGATGYRIQISTSSAFATTVTDDATLTASAYTQTALLPDNGTYYWRVAAKSADGVWSAFTAAQSFTTAYAVYSISYNPNGGINSGGNPATYTGATPTITLQAPTRTGYSFAGWSPSSSIPLGSTGDKTFTASWTANTYSVTFDGQSGSAPSPASMSVTYGSTYGNLATTSRTGYTFDGWWTGTEGAGLEITSSTGVTITANQTFFAKWTVPVAFTGLTANGMSGSVTTTVLTLSFDVDPSSLAADDITVSGATKGTLSGTGTTRTLGISAITVVNGQNVTVALASPAGFTISPASRTVAVYYSLGLTMVSVPAGTFQRDGTATNTSYVSAFRMSEKEITRAQFVAMLGTDPSYTPYSSGTSDPVQTVNWYHAIAFCNKLSLAEGRTPVYSVSGVDFSTLAYAAIPTEGNGTWDAAVATWANDGYRLPTEMEWEWAAMGAMSDARSCDIVGGVNTGGYTKGYAGSTESAGAQSSISAYAWYDTNSGGKTHPVGTAGTSGHPNELGLYDMSGNVWEWNWDWFATGYTPGLLTDYRGAASGTSRVRRGGGWSIDASFCTVSFRYNYNPYSQYNFVGFRVVRP